MGTATAAPLNRRPRARTQARAYLAEVVARFEEHDLLTSASAMSFQILTALVPFLLFAFALLGFLNLASVWQEHIAPNIRPHVSRPAFEVIDESVHKVLGARKVFWLTGGLLLAIWQISGAVRAVMGALNRVYRVRTARPWRRRMLVSVALALVVTALLLTALAVVTLLPLAYGHVGQPAATGLFLVRWGVAGGLMLLAVGLVLRYAPATRRPTKWVTVGTLLVIGSWIAMSIAFGAYLSYVASYGSIFGNLATLVVLLAYIYLSTVAFLAGAQLDAAIRRAVENV